MAINKMGGKKSFDRKCEFDSARKNAAGKITGQSTAVENK